MLLVHGGNGFLGTHIAAYAVQSGVDTVVSGTRAQASPRLPAGITYARGKKTSDLTATMARANTIIYLANRSRPSRHGDGLSFELDGNIAALSEFLHEVSVSGFSGQFFYASSGGQIYGERAPVPAKETDPLRPTTPYGMGKLIAEQIVRYAARTTGLNAAILRIANPVGVGQIGSGHGLVGAIFKALREDVPLSLFGTGRNARDYFDVDDLSRLLVRLHDEGWRGDGVFNIGSGIGRTERDVLDAVRAVTGAAPRLEFKPARVFDLDYAVVDPSKAEAQLGWNPDRDFEAMLARMNADFLQSGSDDPRAVKRLADQAPSSAET